MVLDIHIMRLALASVALICGAAVCDAKSPTSKYCSDGFEETGPSAELVFFENGPELRVKGKTINLAEGNPTWVERMTFGKIDYWTEGIEYRDQEIIIYKDRAFWPCRKN
jgi:hypothetical protein